jgi:hypothetical protein
MDSKGFIEPAKWREFCGPVVPLAMFAKNTWRSDEPFQAEVRVANYGPIPISGPVHWTLQNGSTTLAAGDLTTASLPSGEVSIAGQLSASLARVDVPAKVRLTVEVDGHRSSWPLWVYGRPSVAVPTGVTIASRLDDATLDRLRRGERVVLFPKAEDLPGSIPGDFATDFWNYPMFKGGNPPGTLGFLIQNHHPALAEFPTDFHSDWQWQTLAHHSRAVVLDKFAGFLPILQTIDNFERNHRLGTIFEAKIGAGSLLVCTIDLPSLPECPEAGQLMRSLLDYAASPHFAPPFTLDGAALRKALHG